MMTSNAAQAAPFLKVALAVLISSVDQGIASPTSVELIARSLSDARAEDAELTELLLRLNAAISNYGPTRN
jgi:F0F1-type ATP synthase membrane subunit c/vacuolar-type H+-ATPase subunit K